MGTVNRALQPIPQRYVCKMKYADDVTTDGLGSFRFNLNSLFDPNRSGLGHQPYGFDQLAALYNRYRVVSCGWRVTSPQSVSVRQVGTLPANESTVAIASFAELKENPRAKYVTQMPGGNIQLVSGKVFIPSLMGRTKAQYMADDRYQADTGASPVELAVLNIYVASETGALVAGNLNVLLEYTVEFFDVKPLGQS